MRGRIVQVRDYTDKPNKFLVVELEDEGDLYDILKYHDAVVEIDAVWPDPEG